jgi:hypothetical protein
MKCKYCENKIIAISIPLIQSHETYSRKEIYYACISINICKECVIILDSCDELYCVAGSSLRFIPAMYNRKSMKKCKIEMVLKELNKDSRSMIQFLPLELVFKILDYIDV